MITLFAAALAALAAGLVPAGAQERVRFNPDFSVRDIRAEYGIWTGLSRYTEPTYRMAQATYTRRFWGPFAVRAGGLAYWRRTVVSHETADGIQGGSYSGGFDGFIGLPIGLSIRTRTASTGEALTNAVVYSTMDAIDYSVFGRGSYDGLGGAIIWNFLRALFRRSEFTLGVTPGLYAGNRQIGFGLTGDLGAVLAIPIWRFSLNITPALHYAFVPNKNLVPENAPEGTKPTRLFLSATVGLEYLF